MAPAPEHILIVKLSAIGDVIHTLPALNVLRRQYPGAHITWLVEEAAAGLLQGHPALDRVLVSRRKHWLQGLKGSQRGHHAAQMLAFFRELRDTRYEMILDFQASLKGSLLIALARGARKIGFGRGLEHQEHSYLFLNEKVPAVDMEIHALTRGLLLLGQLGIPTRRIEYDLPVTRRERERIAHLLSASGAAPQAKLVAINPVAQWETKLWGNRKFAALADLLRERYDVTVVFTGGPADRAIVTAITAQMHHQALDLTGCTNLLELAALYERAACLVSTDTGPMHLGAAVGIPVVALFGPTAPWRTGPFGEGHRIVRADCTCAPCYQRSCETCQCMAGITVAQVAAAVEQLQIL